MEADFGGAVSLILDMIDRIVGLKPDRRPPAPPGLVLEIPEEDDPDSVEVSADRGGVSAPLVIIEYRDSQGNFSRRRITLLAVEAGETADYVRAFCHEREQYRSFRLDRILAVADAETGEYLSNTAFSELLAEFGPVDPVWTPPSPQDQAFDACRAGILVLMMIARTDGVFHPAERDIVREFIGAMCGDLRGYDPEPIVAWASRQYPVPDRVARLLTRMVETDRDGSALPRLLDHAIRLARADGVVDDSEVAAIEGIKFARRIALADLGHQRMEDFTRDWKFGVPLPAFCAAIDISLDQRIVRKKPTYVWARGNPACFGFKPGDVFHAPPRGGAGSVTLQVSRVEVTDTLTGQLLIDFRIYQAREEGLAEVGNGTLDCASFEEVLRDGPARLVALSRTAHHEA